MIPQCIFDFDPPSPPVPGYPFFLGGGQNFFAYCSVLLLCVDSDLGPQELFSCIWTL